MTISTLAGCSAQQGTQMAGAGNAIVKAARAICRYVSMLPDAPFPVVDAAAELDASAPPSSGGGQ